MKVPVSMFSKKRADEYYPSTKIESQKILVKFSFFVLILLMQFLFEVLRISAVFSDAYMERCAFAEWIGFHKVSRLVSSTQPKTFCCTRQSFVVCTVCLDEARDFESISLS